MNFMLVISILAILQIIKKNISFTFFVQFILKDIVLWHPKKALYIYIEYQIIYTQYYLVKIFLNDALQIKLHTAKFKCFESKNNQIHYKY